MNSSGYSVHFIRFFSFLNAFLQVRYSSPRDDAKKCSSVFFSGFTVLPFAFRVVIIPELILGYGLDEAHLSRGYSVALLPCSQELIPSALTSDALFLKQAAVPVCSLPYFCSLSLSVYPSLEKYHSALITVASEEVLQSDSLSPDFFVLSLQT